MITVKQAVIVEGKYDKIKLSAFIDAPIIETNGFRIFKDKEKQNLIRKMGEKRGILILTDSDGAGFVIRNFIKGAVPSSQIFNGYIPQILGKEKRKEKPSKEGFLGVEGVEEAIILQAIKNSGAMCSTTNEKTKQEITKTHLYNLGLTGRENSNIMRTKLLKELDLPAYLTTNAMLTAINCLMTKTELEEFCKNL